MAEMRIAVSTGEIDRRCINGNNNTRRGPDKKPRRKRVLPTLKDEVKAGLRARLEILLEFYGTKGNMARRLGVRRQMVDGWFARGRISPEGARRVQRDYKRNGFVGYRASFCRPDLTFDNNGRALSNKCQRKDMLTIKRTFCKDSTS